MRLGQYSKSGDALNDPEGREAADGIRRHGPGPCRSRYVDAPRDPPCQRNNGEHGSDEEQLADLDADVKEQQRDRDRCLRQTDLRQRSSEAEAMQQAEGEGDNPWIPFRQPRLSPPVPSILLIRTVTSHQSDLHEGFLGGVRTMAPP